MMRKQYCVLNKQYTKEQYENLVSKIIEYMKKDGSWGEFYPMKISPFGYNKTTAQMYYPLGKEQVFAKDLKWDDYDPPVPDIQKIVKAADIPDHINDIPDAALKFALKCEVTGKLFKLTPQELQFYRKHKIPLPRRAPFQRHLDRFGQRNPRKFFTRKCTKCKKEIRTTYSPDRMEKVCCESCYMKAAY